MATLELQKVEKSFGSVNAADDISLKIESGEFVTLLGPSGCGKTTTLRMMAGLESPDGGRIFIRGQDVTKEPSYRRKIGMVFQSHALFPHLSVIDNVAFGLRMRGVGYTERRKRAEKALELVRLSGMGERAPSQLSGGQQQRVALARATVFDPEILLLDEPFGALDRKLRETLQIELRDLTRKLGITAVFVTHDQDEALILSDRIAVMNAGRLEQLATPSQLFEHPHSRFVADFMGFGNILPVDVLDETTLRLGDLTLRMQPARSGLGKKAYAAIRPERLSLEAAPSPQANASGVVTSALYQGAQTSYRVNLDEARGAEILVRMSTLSESAFAFDVGQKVFVSWPPTAVRALVD